MNSIYVKARAKINLAIDVLGKREDGYHDLHMVMQSLSLYDDVVIKKIFKEDYLKIVSNLSWLPDDDRNIVYRVAAYMAKTFNLPTGIFIEMNKRIPVSAGLGGGSADCAATLFGIRTLFSLPLTDSDLMEIGAKFGADVPFCVMRGTAEAKGVGEILRKLPPLPHAYVLLVKPPVIISTADVFKKFKFDGNENAKRPNIDELIMRINNRRPIGEIAGAMGNVLELVTAQEYPVIEEIKRLLMEQGAVGSLMSGSGATVFGLFFSKETMKKAASAVRSAFPNIRDVILTDFYDGKFG